MPWSERGTLTTPVPLPPDFDEETAPEDLYDSGERTVFDKFSDVLTGEKIENAECRKLIGIKTLTDWHPNPGGEIISVRKRADGASVIHAWSLTRHATSVDQVKTVERPPLPAFMPRWKCHKEVFAAKIEKIEPPYDPDDQFDGVFIYSDEGRTRVSHAFMDKHNPQVGGYLVIYDDGYQSFSPCKAFEEGYTRIS